MQLKHCITWKRMDTAAFCLHICFTSWSFDLVQGHNSVIRDQGCGLVWNVKSVRYLIAVLFQHFQNIFICYQVIGLVQNCE
jgi:hypothetical protein